MELAECDAVGNIVERELLLRAQTLFALQLQSFVGDVASFLLGVEHVESVAGGRGTVQTENDARFGGLGLSDALVALVEHRFDASVRGSCDDVVADFQCSVRHEHGGNIAATLVQRRFDDGTRRLAVWIGFQFEHFGLE